MQPKPLLPTADKLLPYLKRLDESRHYTNFGTLNAEYQDRLEELFGTPCVTGSSATSLITATLMAVSYTHLKHDDWQETRNRTEPPMPDPRLDIPARVPIAKIKPHIISMLSPKPVSLFRVGKNIGITGGLSDSTLPDN